jgi:hypothetical protein
VSSNESAATLYDSASTGATVEPSLNCANSIDLLGGDLSSSSLSSKHDLDDFDHMNQSSLFDAAELLNTESDIDKILEPNVYGSDKKRRKIE